MPYLGSTPNASFSSRTKQDFTANGSTTSFTLSSAVASANDIEVFVGNVRQEPTEAYTVNGVTLTMSAAPANGINFYVVFKGLEENSVVPADGSISSAKIASGAVSSSKLDTNIAISGNLTVDTNTLKVDSTNNRVGIGIESPVTNLDVVTTSAGTRARIYSNTTSTPSSGLELCRGTDSTFGADNYTDYLIENINGGYLTFKSAINGTTSERIRLDGGNTRGGETTNYRGSSNDGLGSWSLGANGNLVGAVYQDIPIIANRMGNDGYAVSIRRRGTQIGGINISSTTTQYITTSDYRLKENVVDLTGASARVNQLNPSRFNFIADADKTVDGFLAHEVADVVPEAINGAKDAMRDEEYEVTPAILDDDGNVTTEAVMGTRSVPDYQGIDQSKLVPLLTAALQEALTEIASLKTRVQSLEDA